jgi:hypothetical protein
MLASGGTVNAAGTFAFSGVLGATSGGTFNVNGTATAGGLQLAGGTIGGTGALTVTGPGTWSSGTMSGSGSTTLVGTVALNSASVKDVNSGRTVNFNGSTTWANTAADNGRIRTGNGATLQNNGTWLDQNNFTNQISPDFGGAPSTFVNAGSYTKTGTATTTTIAIGFNNGGSVNVNTGTLVLSGGGTSDGGSFSVASGATLEFGGGTHTLNNIALGAGTGRLMVSGGIVNAPGTFAYSGTLTSTGGSFNANGTATTVGLNLAGGTIGGTGTLAITDGGTWTSGTILGAGIATFTGTLALASAGNKDVTNGRRFNFNGSTTWANTAADNGRIRTGNGATLNNNGTWIDQDNFSNQISPDFGGAASTFVNAGSYTKSGTAPTTIAIGFSNSGTVNVNAGAVNLTGGFTNFSGTTLTGGNVNVRGASSFGFVGANVVTNASGITLDGVGSQFLNLSSGTNGLAAFATNAAAGNFTIRNGRNFTTLGAFGNAGIVQVGAGSTFTGSGLFTNQTTGQLQMAGGSYAGPSLSNAGQVNGFGMVTPVVQNTGTVRASGGTLTLAMGTLGETGTVVTDNGATLSLGAGSTAGRLQHDGAQLALGTNNINLFGDYDNANFGSGNSFTARANVSGTGTLIGVNAAQSLTGDLVAGGANAYVLDFGMVRGGTTATRSFQVANSGTGAGIRGAVQTGAPGVGHIDDSRLSGSGVTAANFGPIAAGAHGANLGVTLTAGAIGGALSAQSVGVVSNFDNVATQTLTLTGFSTVLAQGAATPAGPLNLGNFRVGIAPAVSTQLAVSNTTTGAGAERLGLASATASGNFSAFSVLGGGFVLPGATVSGAVTVASSGGTVGVNDGSVALQFNSNGQLFDASFTNLATNQQSVAVQATGFLTAQPALPSSVALGNFRLVNGASSTFAITNTNLAPSGFQEALNASAGATTPGVTLSGAINGLAPGASSSNFVIGFAPGGSAGPRSGTGTVDLVSDGTGTSGLGLYTLASSPVAVNGTAFNLAAGGASPSPVVVPNQRVGGVGNGSASVTLNITNSAPAGAFSEALDASFASLAGDASSNGASVLNLAAGASNTSAMGVSLSNVQAGARTGSVTLAYASDGTGANGHSGLAAVSIGGQTLSLSGNVYRLASAGAVAPNPVVLANQRVGSALTRGLTLTNNSVTDGFSEALNASIGASGSVISGGSVNLLAAGASSSALFVGMDTSSAGAKAGTATVALASDGSGSSGFGAVSIGTQTVAVSGNVYRLAQASLVSPTSVTLADQRVGGNLSQSLTLSNTAAADGFSERLNAGITASGTAIASGSFSLLAGGASSSALAAGVDTSSAGAKGGTATITLASDGSGTSGFIPFGLTSQTVNISGNVYRLAVPVVDTTPLTLVGRVGDTPLQGAIGVTNNAPDLFTERLNASVASQPAGTVAGAALVLAPNVSGNLSLSLPTTTAGTFSGPVGVALVSSSAGTTSGAPDASLGNVSVNLTGRVYAPAVAQVAPTVVDFGIVRVGDTPTVRTVTVGNGASGALTDTLRASISGGTAPFSTSGTVGGLVAGASNSNNLQLQLATATSGQFTGSANVALTSQNPELADLTLTAATITLQGQVNNIAQAALTKAGGSGSFSGTAFSYTLDFGTVLADASSLTANLVLGNAASGTADALSGSWTLGSTGGFSVGGFGPFSGLAAGATLAGLTVGFDISTEGSFDRVLVLSSQSTNASGPDLALGDITLHLQGSVAAVPEPSIYLMMAMGVLAIGSKARRRLRGQQG